jgi:hypothetical protein
LTNLHAKPAISIVENDYYPLGPVAKFGSFLLWMIATMAITNLTKNGGGQGFTDSSSKQSL